MESPSEHEVEFSSEHEVEFSSEHEVEFSSEHEVEFSSEYFESDSNGEEGSLSEDEASSLEDDVARQDYNVDQNRLWRKKDKIQLDCSFDLTPGPVCNYFADCKHEGDYFLKLIDSEIREKILHETNLYINQKHWRVHVATERELYSFLGINLLMGYHSLPSLTCYWNND